MEVCHLLLSPVIICRNNHDDHFQLGREGRDLENTVCFLAANKCDANPDKYRHCHPPHYDNQYFNDVCTSVISIL